MPIEVRSEMLPSNQDFSGPPTCPPDRVERWLAAKLEKAQTDASERGGEVLGFIVKEADVAIESKGSETVIASRDHLFIAINFPES